MTLNTLSVTAVKLELRIVNRNLVLFSSPEQSLTNVTTAVYKTVLLS